MIKIFAFIFLLLIGFSTVMASFDAHGFVVENVNILDGKDPNGMILIGKVDGIATGSCTVTNNQCRNSVTKEGSGNKIEFFIGSEKAHEVFIYEVWGTTHTNLTFDTFDELTLCGNDECNIGECSLCPLDCNIGKCLDDGACDINVGENCLNSVVDCACAGGSTCNGGVCVSLQTNNGGGSGGKKSGSSMENIVNSTNSTNESIVQNEIPAGLKSIDELNKITEVQNEVKPKTFMSLITGAVVGADGQVSTLVYLLATLFICFVILFSHKKIKKKRALKKSISDETSSKKKKKSSKK